MLDIISIELDGVVIKDWVNWLSFERTIERNDSLKVYGVQTKGNLVFAGDGYRLLVDAKKNLGVTETVSCVIRFRCGDNNIVEVVNGTICLSEVENVVEGTAAECTATCTVQSEALGQFILVNREVKVYIGEGRSLLNNPIPASTPLRVEMFDPVDNSTLAGLVQAYDVKDCFTEIFAALSEDRIVFESSWYDNLPVDERYVITTGINLRLIGNENPQISLSTLYNDFQKKYNLWLFSTYENGQYVVRLEEESFITQTGAIRLEEVVNIVSSTDQARLYSNVKVGSNQFIKDFTDEYTLPYIPLLTHVSEEYTVEAKCAGGTTLDLVSDMIIDSNSIQDAIQPFDDDSNDDELFIVQYDRNTVRAVAATLTSTAGDIVSYQYNPALINSAVTDRWRVQGAITNNFSPVIDLFKVGSTLTSPILTQTGEWSPAELDSDSGGTLFNDNNRWDTAQYQFETQETGIYKFSGEIWIDYIDNSLPTITTDILLMRIYSPEGVFLREQIVGANAPAIQPIGTISSVDFQNVSVYLQKGQLVQMVGRVETQPEPTVGLQYQFIFNNPLDVTEITFLEMSSAITTGDLTTPQSEETYFSEIISFSHPYASDLWLAFETNPAQAVEIFNTTDEGFVQITKGWASSITTNLISGETQWELITNPLGEPFS